MGTSISCAIAVYSYMNYTISEVVFALGNILMSGSGR